MTKFRTPLFTDGNNLLANKTNKVITAVPSGSMLQIHQMEGNFEKQLARKKLGYKDADQEHTKQLVNAQQDENRSKTHTLSR